MKKKWFMFLLALASTGVAEAGTPLVEQYGRMLTPPPTYVCLKAKTPLTIDGLLNEEEWQRAPYTAAFVDISGEGFPRPKYRTRAKMLWDNDFLYIGAELEEPNIKALLKQRDTIIYKDNDFEVFIDPDGDGRAYFEIELNALNTVFDLMLDRPYRVDGNFFMQWDCPGLQTAVHCDGTLNDSTDTDRGWTVEMAIPRKAISTSFDNPLQEGRWRRLDFSRVEWLKKGGPEENWVWGPTGKVDMHMPERWAYVMLAGHEGAEFSYPYDQKVYQLMWSLYYAQDDYRRQHGHFAPSLVALLGVHAKDSLRLPKGAEIRLDAARTVYRITVKADGREYSLDSNGEWKIMHNTL